MTSRLILGIDLGTTNSAMSVASVNEQGGEPATQSTCLVPQYVAAGQIAPQPTLPSFLYIPHPGEAVSPETGLPWEHGTHSPLVGAWARDRGALTPERLVMSAKSWLANAHIDRQSPVLPWRSELKDGKVSPLEASRIYLSHLLAAFVHEQKAAGPDVLETTHAVLAVPASFDEVARNLTSEAARSAGLKHFSLLEEPLAAFYSWLAQDDKGWREHVKPGDVVLVCDVGGGTTDFSIIAVSEEKGEVALTRVAVGDHLLLGGDNMDLALSYRIRSDLERQGQKLDHWQFMALLAAARGAKERLLAEDGLASVNVSVASRGASLFAGTVSAEVTRAQVVETLVDGFFPMTRVDEMPLPRRSTGIQEFGLNYESDAAISRHLARFLRRAWQNVRTNQDLAKLVEPRLRDQSQHLMPTAVLFNGGAFKAPALRERVLELLKTWNDDLPMHELAGAELDLAVSRGAAYYGQLRASGRGIRVQSGTARSYYVGLEAATLAVPGFEPPVHGLCLVPQGTDEGTELPLLGQEFGLVVGEPVEFRFFSSAVRAGDTVGTLVNDAPRELDESARLSVTLPSEDGRDGDVVPVRLDALIDDVGVLQLSMKNVASGRKWNLEFNVRPHDHG